MTSVDDLVTWLRAQLDVDEAAADAILSPPPGHYDKGWQADELRKFAQQQLADVDAKRRIIELHSPFTNTYKKHVQCGHCAEQCHSYSGLSCDTPADALWPCPTARLLALPYADRPGYREEWRP